MPSDSFESRLCADIYKPQGPEATKYQDIDFPYDNSSGRVNTLVLFTVASFHL